MGLRGKSCVHHDLGELAASAARHHRIRTPTMRSTMRSTACMKPSTMNQSDSVIVRHARPSEEPGAEIPHAGIRDGDAGPLAFLP